MVYDKKLSKNPASLLLWWFLKNSLDFKNDEKTGLSYANSGREDVE